MVTVRLSPEEIILIQAIGKLVESGRPTGATFTARALAGWLPEHLPRHLRSERMVGPVLDLMGCEPDRRTSRRAAADLQAVIAEWTALARAQQDDSAPQLLGF